MAIFFTLFVSNDIASSDSELAKAPGGHTCPSGRPRRNNARAQTDLVSSRWRRAITGAQRGPSNYPTRRHMSADQLVPKGRRAALSRSFSKGAGSPSQASRRCVEQGLASASWWVHHLRRTGSPPVVPPAVRRVGHPAWWAGYVRQAADRAQQVIMFTKQMADPGLLAWVAGLEPCSLAPKRSEVKILKRSLRFPWSLASDSEEKTVLL